MIKTQRLVLRPFKESDLDDLYEYLSEITIHCFMDMKAKTRNERYQNKGYMTEAARAYITYLFEKCGARRVYAYTEDYNISCQKLLEKLGFRREGLYKEFVSFVNDEQGNPIYENTYEYAVLKKEWSQK